MKCLNTDPNSTQNKDKIPNALFFQQIRYYAVKEKSLLELAKITQKKKLQHRLYLLRRYLILRRKAHQKQLLQHKLLDTRSFTKPMLTAAHTGNKNYYCIPIIQHLRKNNCGF